MLNNSFNFKKYFYNFVADAITLVVPTLFVFFLALLFLLAAPVVTHYLTIWWAYWGIK